MAALPDHPRRPAKRCRWAASALTALVTVGAVGAMASAARSEGADQLGSGLGKVTRSEGVRAAEAMMGEADSGNDPPAWDLLARVGRADVS